MMTRAEAEAFIINGPNTSFVDNINGSGTVSYENCLYGGYATDAEYLAESAGQGFAVEGEDFITIQ